MEPERWQRRRLTRSSRERMWAGVAGGLAEYFDVDPTLMRLMWVVATVITAGLFVAVYFVMWVIMPLDSAAPADRRGGETPPPEDTPVGQRRDYWTGLDPYYVRRKRRSAGIVLIVLGLLFLSAQAGLFRWMHSGVVWAVVLIILGAALLLRQSDWRL